MPMEPLDGVILTPRAGLFSTVSTGYDRLGAAYEQRVDLFLVLDRSFWAVEPPELTVFANVPSVQVLNCHDATGVVVWVARNLVRSLPQ